MNGCRVIFSTKLACDSREAHMKLATEKVHGDLAGNNDMFIAFCTADFFGINLEMTSCLVNNLFGSKVLGSRMTHVSDNTFGDGNIGSNAAHLGIGKKLIERTLEFTNICFDVLSEVLCGFTR